MSLPKGEMDKARSRANLMNTPFLMLQAHPDDFKKISVESQKNVHNETVLSKLFFHPKNVRNIQKLITKEVFKRSNGEYLIEEQNPEDLLIVMKSIFLQHAKHWPNKIREQIQELNYLVVDDVVPGIMSEIKAYFGYLDRAFGEREFMDRPLNASTKGQKTLPSVTSRYSN